MVKEGMPDFGRFMKIINDQNFKPQDLLSIPIEEDSFRPPNNQFSTHNDNHLSASPKFNNDTDDFESFHPRPPGDSIQRPPSPSKMQTGAFRANNFSQLFEYM